MELRLRDPLQGTWRSRSETLAAELPPLDNSGMFYTGPEGQNDCLCNTVVYSLLEACQLCQFYVPSLVQT